MKCAYTFYMHLVLLCLKAIALLSICGAYTFYYSYNVLTDTEYILIGLTGGWGITVILHCAIGWNAAGANYPKQKHAYAYVFFATVDILMVLAYVTVASLWRYGEYPILNEPIYLIYGTWGTTVKWVLPTQVALLDIPVITIVCLKKASSVLPASEEPVERSTRTTGTRVVFLLNVIFNTILLIVGMPLCWAAVADTFYMYDNWDTWRMSYGLAYCVSTLVEFILVGLGSATLGADFRRRSLPISYMSIAGVNLLIRYGTMAMVITTWSLYGQDLHISVFNILDYNDIAVFLAIVITPPVLHTVVILPLYIMACLGKVDEIFPQTDEDIAYRAEAAEVKRVEKDALREATDKIVAQNSVLATAPPQSKMSVGSVGSFDNDAL